MSDRTITSVFIRCGSRKRYVKHHPLIIFANEVLKMVDDRGPTAFALEGQQNIHTRDVITVKAARSNNLAIFYENAHVT